MVNAELRSAIYVQPRLCFIHRSNIKLLENHSLERKQRRKKGIREKMAQEGQVNSCRNLDDWNKGLQDAKDSKKLVVVNFTASWSAQCRFMAPVLVEQAKQHTSVKFLKVDVDEVKSAAEDWAVEVMPTFVFLKDGKLVDKVVGAKKRELQRTIKKHATAA